MAKVAALGQVFPIRAGDEPVAAAGTFWQILPGATEWRLHALGLRADPTVGGTVMRTALLNVPACAICALAVGGCVTTQGGGVSFMDRVNIRMDCQKAIGPEPFALANGFGLVGGIIKVSQPEWKAWSARVEACSARNIAQAERAASREAKAAPRPKP